MKAVIFATGDRTAPEGSGEKTPSFLLHLIDRPFLQHVVEFVAEAGIVDGIDIVLSHSPEKIEAIFGDGARWGIRIRYHLARDAARPYAALSRIETAGPILLVHADCLPQAAIKQAATTCPVAFCSGQEWTGWALLDSRSANQVDPSWDRDQFTAFVMDAASHTGSLRDCPVVLGVRSELEFLASQRAALEKRFPGLLFYGREVQDGIWIARNVSLHPTANLVAPVYLGENSRIGAGVLLGPNVVVVRDCVLDSGTTVQNSAILPGSYIGQALELDHVIIDRNRLTNVRSGGQTIVRDDFILSAINRNMWRTAFASLISRTVALWLLALTWPVVLLTALILRLFREGPVVHSAETVALPATGDQWEWKTFAFKTFAPPDARLSAAGNLVLRFLPGLISVVRGRLYLVGVSPRRPEEVAALPEDWRILYLKARAGLVTEAFALHGTDATPDDIYSSEAYYAVAAGARHDAIILLRYLASLFRLHQPTRQSGWSGVHFDAK